MKAFLQEVAEYLSNKYNNDFTKIRLVFPNRRSILYFNKYLSNYVSEPLWAPECITINRLFEEHTQWAQAEELLLVFNLYKAYCKETGSNESFDAFFTWGKMLVSDFDDIDKYLIDPTDLFRNIKDLKELEVFMNGFSEEDEAIIKGFWGHIIDSRDSDEKQIFTKLWSQLLAIYKRYKLGLEQQKIAYQGMIYRNVVENIDQCEFEANYWFIGFNALNKCEKSLLSKLKKSDKANFLWDYDTMYVNNPLHEAGLFMRSNLKQFAPPNDFMATFTSIESNNLEIVYHPAVSGVSQTKSMSGIIENWQKQDDFDPERTAVVLADETMLLPVMYGIPPEVGTYNISMGYPLHSTASAAFVRNLIQLQLQTKYVNTEASFYFKPVISLLQHSMIKHWSNEDTDKLAETIIKENKVLLSKNDFEAGNLSFVFVPSCNTVSDLMQYLDKVINEFVNMKVDENEQMLQEQYFLNHIALQLSRVNELIEEYKIPLTDTKTYASLIEQIIRSTNIPFKGEPMEGMQVLGFLETRPLDFDRIIMLSMNEGVFPKKSVAPSFIPQNLRIGFKMPSQEYRDAIFAYYFYRLLQASKQVHIFYNLATTDLGGGEPSRFITQLKYEHPNMLRKEHMQRSVHLKAVPEFQVSKSEDIYQQILKVCKGTANRRLSASAINQYIKCPMMFYFSIILEHREPDTIQEDIDYRQFGTIFHKAMQLLYNPKDNIKENITPDIIDNWLKEENNKHLRDILSEAFRIVYFKNRKVKLKLFGKNKIDFEVLLRLVKQLITLDKDYAPFDVIHEKKEEIQLKIEGNSDLKSALIKAYIDRIDTKEGRLRVLDYKTGAVHNEFTTIDALFESGRKKDLDPLLQIFLYSIMYEQNNEIDNSAQPGLIYLKNIYEKSDFYIIRKENKTKQKVYSVDKAFADDFMNHLSDTISEILNKDLPFEQTQNEDHCEYCSFKSICKG